MVGESVSKNIDYKKFIEAFENATEDGYMNISKAVCNVDEVIGECRGEEKVTLMYVAFSTWVSWIYKHYQISDEIDNDELCNVIGSLIFHLLESMSVGMNIAMTDKWIEEGKDKNNKPNYYKIRDVVGMVGDRV